MEKKTAKQQAIEKAWGENWPLAKTWVYPFTDGGGTAYINELKSTGWLTINFVPEPLRKVLYFDMFENLNGSVRPKSLKGIETNNGWIRIDEVEMLHDVPLNFYKVLFADGSIDTLKPDTSLVEAWAYWKITHYKPIEPELLPIY